MVEKDPQSSRRSVLKCLGATALVMGTIGEVSHSAKAKKSISHTTLRGKVSSPIDVKEIEKEKEKFLNKLTKNRSRAFLDAEQAFNSESIIGYNLIRLKKGTVHEQFVVVNRENKNQIETNKRVNNSGTSSEVTNKTGVRPNTATESPSSVNKWLHSKADELLMRGVNEVESSTSTTQAQVTSSDEVDWSSWEQFGKTDVYFQLPPDDLNTRPGNIELTNRIRRSSEDSRVSARTKIRMEPGRQICNDDRDEYCSPSVQTGWLNRRCVINHDWDQYKNDVSTEDLIVGTTPEGQESDVQGTYTGSISLKLDRNPELNLGYSTSVTYPGSDLTDKTTKATGRAEFEWEANTPKSTSAKNNAIFSVASGARYKPSCSGQIVFLDIDIDFVHSFDLEGNWVNKIVNDKHYSYYADCE
ncbi:hypothetical protein [Halogeometricum borinquense]|nr:hypothetical protein [Halogeometricum borinquense]